MTLVENALCHTVRNSFKIIDIAKEEEKYFTLLSSYIKFPGIYFCYMQ